MSVTSCPRCGRTFEEGIRFCPVDGALVTQAASDPHLGRVLMGQFELREVAGRGAMGTVYRAYQRTMDRIVAVKILRAEIVKEPGVLRRFLREARAAAKLQHPNIVTVHMVGETDDGVPYLVMEHIDGVSLEAICEAQGPQPLPRVTWFGRQIASALSEAHNVGIIHRDLKPANILVTDRSRTPDLVKVLDFGIAKLVHANGPDQSMVTADGTIFGTPHYIAPEQASGVDVDHRADLYSLGVILFRLTTGVLPFEGTQSMQVVLKHLREEPPAPRSINPAIPSAMEELILACLAKNRARRPDDADALIAALDRIDSSLSDGGRTIKGMPLKRIESRMTPLPVEVLPPVHAPQKTPVWANGAGGAGGARERPATPSSGARVLVRTPPGGTRTSGTHAAVATRVSSGHTPRSITAQVAAQRSRGNRAVWIGVFLAATIGASVGVLAALTHNVVDDERAPRAQPAAAAVVPTAPAMVAPRPGETVPSLVKPVVAPLAAPTATQLATPTGTQVATPTAAMEPPRKEGAVDARGRAVVTPGKPVAALRRHGQRHDGDDDLPVTVVPSDEPKVVAHPLPVTRTQPPVAAPAQPATPPAEAPPPATAQPQPQLPVPLPTAKPTPPAPPPARDDEPPPAPPPAGNDPTTLPPPPPGN
jgi:serine/threonine protein kinase